MIVQNVFVNKHFFLQVLDFGLSRELSGDLFLGLLQRRMLLLLEFLESDFLLPFLLLIQIQIASDCWGINALAFPLETLLRQLLLLLVNSLLFLLHLDLGLELGSSFLLDHFLLLLFFSLLLQTNLFQETVFVHLLLFEPQIMLELLVLNASSELVEHDVVCVGQSFVGLQLIFPQLLHQKGVLVFVVLFVFEMSQVIR